MAKVFLSKDYGKRKAFVEQFLAESEAAIAIYIFPKNRKKEFIPPAVPGCLVKCFTYEDMGKTNEWLTINALVSAQTALILDNPSRYPKITSQKVLMLERLEKMIKPSAKALVDIVPFTLDIQYLYTPYSYMGREILGYAHYYAFRENYHEQDLQGRVRMSHDFDLLAEKVKPITEIDYSRFLCSQRTTVNVESTAAERDRYQTLREECFSVATFTPRVAITALADLVHGFESRLDAMLDIASGLSGKTVVMTNLGTYAKRAQALLKKNGIDAIATSYQSGFTGHFDNCIYLESPIVKTYFLLDAESRLPPSTKVFHVLGDTKVDELLYKNLTTEINQIDEFTRELSKAKQKALPNKECLASGRRADQLDLFQLQNSCR